MMSRIEFPNEERPLSKWVVQEGSLDKMRSNHTARLILSMLRPENIFTRRTRGDDLQMRLEEDLLSTGQMDVLGDIFKKKDETVQYPYWFMNSTDMSTGRIIPFTPANLERENIVAYWHGRQQKIDDYFNVPIAVGIRSSMNFPVAIPPTTLEPAKVFPEKVDFLHLSDGGLADNLGVIVAIDVLNSETVYYPKNGRKRLLIVIDAFRGAGQEDISARRSPPGMIRSIVRGLNLPLAAHRYRIRHDYSNENAHRLSVLDAMAESNDLGVVYIHMDFEKRQVRKTRTNLYLSARRQRQLVCAGLHQTLLAFGARDDMPQVVELKNELQCAEDKRSLPDAGILAFGKGDKEALMAELGNQVVESVTQAARDVVNLRSEVDQQVRHAPKDYLSNRVRSLLSVDSQDESRDSQENPMSINDDVNIPVQLDDEDIKEDEHIKKEEVESLSRYLNHVVTMIQRLESLDQLHRSASDEQSDDLSFGEDRAEWEGGDVPDDEAEGEGIFGWFSRFIRWLVREQEEPDLDEDEQVVELRGDVISILKDIHLHAGNFRCQVCIRMAPGEKCTRPIWPDGVEECSHVNRLWQVVVTLEESHASLLRKSSILRLRADYLHVESNRDLYDDLVDFFELTQIPRTLASWLMDREREALEQEKTKLEEKNVALVDDLNERRKTYADLELEANSLREEFGEFGSALRALEEDVVEVAACVAAINWTAANSCIALDAAREYLHCKREEFLGKWKSELNLPIWEVEDESLSELKENIVEEVRSLLQTIDRVNGVMKTAHSRWPDLLYRDRIEYGSFLSFSYEDYADLSRYRGKIPYKLACKERHEKQSGLDRCRTVSHCCLIDSKDSSLQIGMNGSVGFGPCLGSSAVSSRDL